MSVITILTIVALSLIGLLHFYWALGGVILSGIFALRGIGEFNAVGLFKKIKSSEFAYYDTRFYTPFALAMGMVFAVLAYRVS